MMIETLSNPFTLHLIIVFIAACLTCYELWYTLKVLKFQDITAAMRHHMEVHLKYLAVGIPLLIYLEVKLLTDGDTVLPITYMIVWLIGIVHHLHGESSAIMRGSDPFDVRSFTISPSKRELVNMRKSKEPRKEPSATKLINREGEIESPPEPQKVAHNKIETLIRRVAKMRKSRRGSG